MIVWKDRLEHLLIIWFFLFFFVVSLSGIGFVQSIVLSLKIAVMIELGIVGLFFAVDILASLVAKGMKNN